jgi:predicted Zn finger-like uncharacterized protein
MILTCPQCSTRYQVDGAKFPSTGRNVRCAKCGNVWHQLGPMAEPDPESEIIVEEPVPRPIQRLPPEPVAVQPRAAAFVPAPPRQAEAEVEEPAPRRARRSWLGRIALFFGWLILIALIAAIGWSTVRFRDNVAMLLPSAKSFYSAVGLPVSSRGLDFTNVTYHQTRENGQPVLFVTGRIINHSAHEQTLPRIHIALFDADRHQVFAWNTVAPVSTLKSGQATNFKLRLASPPEDSHTVEVRFTRAGE